MHFEYEIGVDEYVASQILYRKLNNRGRNANFNSIVWMFIGISAVVVAFNQPAMSLAPVLLFIAGGLWVYASATSLFPGWYIRRHYKSTDFWGAHFSVEANEIGFEVITDQCRWYIHWAAVKLKGENDKVFMFYSANTVFSFGKRFLNSEQQQELRRLSGMAAVHAN